MLGLTIWSSDLSGFLSAEFRGQIISHSISACH